MTKEKEGEGEWSLDNLQFFINKILFKILLHHFFLFIFLSDCFHILPLLFLKLMVSFSLIIIATYTYKHNFLSLFSAACMYLFPWLTTLCCITIRGLVPGEDRFFSAVMSSCSSLSRGGGPMSFLHCHVYGCYYSGLV